MTNDEIIKLFENLGFKIYDDSIIRKKYNYEMVIIRLYGILEAYIEACIATYLRKLSKCVKEYKRLPRQIQEQHLSLSADLLKYIEKGYDKYNEISQEDVIFRLGDCLKNASEFRLNTSAFLHHNSNFRQETIRDFFHHVGIENITNKVINHIIFKQYFKYNV